MPDYSIDMSVQKREDCGLDNVFTIFKAYNHPVLLVEECAMRWMGLRVSPEEDLDLLVRDSQTSDIMDSILATGDFERVEQDINLRFNDPYAKPVPRLRDKRCPPGFFTCISLWSETIYKLRVEDAEPVPVMDIFAWNECIAEERFATIPETAYLAYGERTKSGTQIFPPAWGSAKGLPVFIPSIPKMCDAILDQLRYRVTHAEELHKGSGNRPAYHLRNFVRYLHLEKPSQRRLLLSLLAERNRPEMELRITGFKRKPTLAELKASLGRA